MPDITDLQYEHERDVARALELVADAQDSYKRANDRLDESVVRLSLAIKGRRKFESALRHALLCHTMQDEERLLESVHEIQMLWDEHLTTTSGILIQVSMQEEIDVNALQDAATGHWSATQAYWKFKRILGHAQIAERRWA